MSSIARVEVYDAQMLDYLGSDNDIPMFSVAPSTSGSWNPIEATMDDDNNTLTLDSISHSTHSEPLEVDMDAEYDDIKEYEMADEGHLGSSALTAEDLVDVEVLDAQYITEHPTATAIGDGEEPSTAPSVEFGHSLPLLPQMFTTSQMLSAPEEAHDHPIATEIAEHDVVDAHLVPEDVSSHPDFVEPAPSELIADEVDPVYQTPPASGEETSNLQEVATSDFAPAIEESTSTHSESTDLGVAVDSTQSEPVEPPTAPTEAHASDQEHTAVDLSHEEASADLQEAQEGDNNGQFAEQEDYTSSGDPHEISEGLYIDPPPPVLIAVVHTHKEHNFSLFNQPAGRSSPPSPGAPSTKANETLASQTLLHERPTLYYEPLRAVFEALRREAPISELAEFAEGELILEAYDLQLVVSEDNVHTQEVTLHDLNILHDGLQLTGPLRVRLYASSPRFISRYHALRDQITKLHLSEDVDAYGYEEAGVQLQEEHEPSDQNENVEEDADDDVQIIPAPQHEESYDAVEVASDLRDGDEAYDDPESGTQENPIEVGEDDEYEDDAEGEDDDEVEEVHLNEFGAYDVDNFEEDAPLHEDVENQETIEPIEQNPEDPQQSPATDRQPPETVVQKESELLEHPDDAHNQVDDQELEDLKDDAPDPNGNDDENEPKHVTLLEEFEDAHNEENTEETADFEGFRHEEETQGEHDGLNAHDASKDEVAEANGRESLKEGAELHEHTPVPSETNGEDELYGYDDDEIEEILDAPPRLHSEPSTETLESKSSKRSFDQVDSDGEEVDYEHPPLSSPDSKRLRVD